MSYRVELRPDVRAEINKWTRTERNKFDRAISSLIDNPFPRRDFPFIKAVENDYGDKFYSYLDDSLRWVLQYDVTEIAEADDELVAAMFDGNIDVFSLTPVDDDIARP